MLSRPSSCAGLIATVIGGGARRLHEGSDALDELLDRNLLEKKKGGGDDEEALDPSDERRLTSARREALSLYRDIIRASRFFSWPDSDGVLWRDVLRSNARREFEEARFERDPEIITRLLIGGQDAVHSALDKLADAHRKKIDEEKDHINGRRSGHSCYKHTKAFPRVF